MIKYKVVRTYDDGSYMEPLQVAFNDGWQFLRASEYVPECSHGGERRFGYIEYILVKEEPDEKTDKR